MWRYVGLHKQLIYYVQVVLINKIVNFVIYRQEDQFVLYQHLPEMKQLLDIDNILIYILPLSCLPENDIRRIEEAERINTDKAVRELASLVKKRGSLDKFLKALKRSAHEEDHPGHKELLDILQKTVQGEKETQAEHSRKVWDTCHKEPIDTRETFQWLPPAREEPTQVHVSGPIQ